MCQTHYLSENFRKRQCILSMEQVNGRQFTSASLDQFIFKSS